jgi:Helix-turn-helix domain
MKDLAGSNLTTSSRAVFAALCEFGNQNSEMWPSWVPRSIVGFFAWPSIKRLEIVTGLSKRGTQVALKELEREGAVLCVYRSRGGAPRRTTPSAAGHPAKTNAYLLTPQSLRRSIETEPGTSFLKTTKLKPENGAVTAPYVANHHQSEGNNDDRRQFQACIDQEPTADKLSKRNPEAELRRRMKLGHNDESGGLAYLVLRGLGFEIDLLSRFLLYDAVRTGDPVRVLNPGAYYRSLVRSFLRSEETRKAHSEKEGIERDECTLGMCDGTGQIYKGQIVTACDCKVGRSLPSTVLELMEAVNSAAKEYRPPPDQRT